MMNLNFLFRKKKFNVFNKVEDTNLSRVMSLFDVTALGMSCTLGVGIYILAGDVIANYAGPGIILSFIIAGLATFVAGLCYAELGSRVPRSGSAYVYIYVTIGELVAFIMGWDLILEYSIGVSSTASALSNYVDTLVDYKISQFFTSLAIFSRFKGLAAYPDFLACAFVLTITILLMISVKESSILNNITCVLNVVVLVAIVVIGLFAADFNNWFLNPKTIANWTDTRANTTLSCETSKKCGEGGFLPFGFSGVLAGAAKCFYAFIGFDCIASTGEEILNPKKNLPLSIILTLVIVSLLYCSTSTVLTLMIPYYMIEVNAPIPSAFAYVHLEWAKTLISVGAIVSLVACLYGSIFAIPRILYSMSLDGLLFSCLSKVNSRTKTPINAILLVGVFSAIMATILDLNQLIELLSIGTLMGYSMVAICVLTLRYRPSNYDVVAVDNTAIVEKKSEKSLLKQLTTSSDSKKCDLKTSSIVNLATFIGIFDIFILCYLLTRIFEKNKLYDRLDSTPASQSLPMNRFTWIAILINETAFAILLLVILAGCMLVISRQPQNEDINTFKVPFVPVLPLLSVLINVYLMMTLTWQAWIRFLIWFSVGLIIYFAYGIQNSRENVESNSTPILFKYELELGKLTTPISSKSKNDYEAIKDEIAMKHPAENFAMDYSEIDKS